MEKEIIIKLQKELKVIREEFEKLLKNNTSLEVEEFKNYLDIDNKIYKLELDLIEEEYKN